MFGGSIGANHANKSELPPTGTPLTKDITKAHSQCKGTEILVSKGAKGCKGAYRGIKYLSEASTGARALEQCICAQGMN